MTPNSIRRQRWKRGAVVRIPLGAELYAYAQMLSEPEYAVFALRDSGAATAEWAATQPVLFRLWVMRQAHSSGRWDRIGDAPLQPQLNTPVLRFNQDPINPEIIHLSEHGTGGVRVTADECDAYERAAIWSAAQVEDRIRDYFAGVANKWLESMKERR